ncbi:MAG: NADH-quinone oxidoreductase subunit C [Dehalococcoidia bacterium]
MTIELSGQAVADRIRAIVPESAPEPIGMSVFLPPEQIVPVTTALRDDPELRMQFLVGLTAVDYLSHFEVVYHIQSFAKNHLAVLKVRLEDRELPEMPSVTGVWWGAQLQEREVYDLFGIRFAGHPDLRRIFLWEGFAGYPLRKDFLQIANGAQHPGLPHFPKQEQGYGVLSGPNWSSPEEETPRVPA